MTYQAEGVYQTELGTSVNVIKLTQDSMLAVQPAVQNIQQDYAHLFSTPHRSYSLRSGRHPVHLFMGLSGNDPAKQYH